MTVGIQGDEGQSEDFGDRWLLDGHAQRLPVRVQAPHRVVIGDGEGDFAAMAGDGRRRADAVRGPQAERVTAFQREGGIAGKGVQGLAVEQALVEATLARGSATYSRNRLRRAGMGEGKMGSVVVA